MPLRFRALNNPGSREQTTQSEENISQCGLFFLTKVPLKVEAPLEASLCVPQEPAGSLAGDVEGKGTTEAHEETDPSKVTLFQSVRQVEVVGIELKARLRTRKLLISHNAKTAQTPRFAKARYTPGTPNLTEATEIAAQVASITRL
jgi:hypothetical protein